MKLRVKGKWLWFLAGWTVLGLIFAGQLYFAYLSSGQKIEPRDAIAIGLIEWYSWAVVSLPIIQISRLFPINSQSWRRTIPLHFASGLLFLSVQLVLQSLVQTTIVGAWMQFGDGSALLLFSYLISKKFLTNLLTYGAIVGATQTIDYYRQRELRESQLQLELSQAQLQTLKLQIHPHFLFNTLHSISALVHQDAEVADRMIVRLSEFLRSTLEDSELAEVTLRHELDVLQKYLEIELVRFQDRLSVSIDAAPEVLDAIVPNLLLQPIVENAFRHGIEAQPGAGSVEILASLVGEKLLISVRDSGSGLHAERSSEFKEGIGLTNIRARLSKLYGSDYAFILSDRQAGGLEVTIKLPLSFREVLLGKTAVDPSPAVQQELLGI